MFPWRTRMESWQFIRRRMIRETEHFLEDALRHPERRIAIPAVRVGAAGFPRGFAHAVWAQVLGAS